MPAPRDVQVQALDPARLGPLIGEARLAEMLQAATETVGALGGATVWQVSSTSDGGGVAEMLHTLLGYVTGSGVPTRWVVLEGDADFFAITKRLHNQLHGSPGDGGDLGRDEAEHYDRVSQANAAALARRVHPGDVVILHDPQTAGLAGPLVERGAKVVWRCHVGTERSNVSTKAAWSFLVPLLAPCRAVVFSHQGFVPEQLAGADVWIIAPSIDPCAPKNAPLARARTAALLARVGVAGPVGAVRAAPDGSEPVVVGGSGPLAPDDHLVLQVSRWDRLKDMQGVMEGFAARLGGHPDLHLALVGPAVEAVTDDPEGAMVYQECVAAWQGLAEPQRRTVRLVTLPMADAEENARMVNALQRRATVVVQKSLEEGFGLTVAEAMWKARPVVASAVGGIVQQVVPGTGLLVQDPHDLAAFGDALAGLMASPDERAVMGRRARRHVRAHFLSDRHLIEYAALVRHVARF